MKRRNSYKPPPFVAPELQKLHLFSTEGRQSAPTSSSTTLVCRLPVSRPWASTTAVISVLRLVYGRRTLCPWPARVNHIRRGGPKLSHGGLHTLAKLAKLASAGRSPAARHRCRVASWIPRQAGGVGVTDARGDALADRLLDLRVSFDGVGRHVSDPAAIPFVMKKWRDTRPWWSAGRCATCPAPAPGSGEKECDRNGYGERGDESAKMAKQAPNSGETTARVTQRI